MNILLVFYQLLFMLKVKVQNNQTNKQIDKIPDKQLRG